MIKIIDVNDLQRRSQFEVARIQDHDDFTGLLALINKGIEKGKDFCVKNDGVELYRAQGKVQALQELLQAIEDAVKLVTENGNKILPIRGT